MKKENKKILLSIISIVFIFLLGSNLVGHIKENREKAKEEARKIAIEKQVQSIDFSNVNNASKDIDKILKPQVKNYMSSDVTLYKGKYIVDVYIKLNEDKYFTGSDELKDKFPVILDTLYKNNKIDSVCIWGNAKTNFKHEMIEGNFVSATFDRKTYKGIKDFKELVRTMNGKYIIEEKATSYTLDKRYELDYN